MAPKTAARKTSAKKSHGGFGAGAECIAKLDRLRLVCTQDPTPALKLVPGFQSLNSHFIRRPAAGKFQAYGRVHWFGCRKSRMKFLIESERREKWIKPYRVTLFADDRQGLLPSEVFSVLEVLPDFQLTLIELAFDFRGGVVNRRFVRNHALFGKSQPRPSVEGTDYWGTRAGTKFVRTYQKDLDDAV
jgi:hypothetical protein